MKKTITFLERQSTLFEVQVYNTIWNDYEHRPVNKVFEERIKKACKYAPLVVGTEIQMETLYTIQRVQFQADGRIWLFLKKSAT